MTGDDERTWLLDHDPANLLPYSKRLIPEDPEAETLGRQFVRDSVAPELYG
jgi:hypothetical protein